VEIDADKSRFRFSLLLPAAIQKRRCNGASLAACILTDEEADQFNIESAYEAVLKIVALVASARLNEQRARSENWRAPYLRAPEQWGIYPTASVANARTSFSIHVSGI
jgi:hypothetical protein